MTFQPYPDRSGFILLGVALILGIGSIFLIRLLSHQDAWTGSFQLFVVVLAALLMTGLALYWAIIAFTLHYHLNRNGLAIQWGMAQQRVPFESIKTTFIGEIG